MDSQPNVPDIDRIIQRLPINKAILKPVLSVCGRPHCSRG